MACAVELQGFSLRTVKFLVMDEADRMLSMDFEESLDKILQVLQCIPSVVAVCTESVKSVIVVCVPRRAFIVVCRAFY